MSAMSLKERGEIKAKRLFERTNSHADGNKSSPDVVTMHTTVSQKHRRHLRTVLLTKTVTLQRKLLNIPPMTRILI